MNTKTVLLNGINLHFEIEGEGDSPGVGEGVGHDGAVELRLATLGIGLFIK